jgi:hypothetical protein
MQEDTSRAVWPSCPASGWATGVHRLTGLPNGNPLTTHPAFDGNTAAGIPSAPAVSIETHGPYQHGTGFVSANGHSLLRPFDSTLPVTFTTNSNGNATGWHAQGSPSVFASEFGCSVFSSFESMSATLNESHWGIHAGMPGERKVSW